MTWKRFGKKGVLDNIYIVIVIVALALLTVFGYKILSDMNTQIQAMDGVAPEGKVAFSSVTDRYHNTMDTAFLVIWFAALMASLISAWFIDTHPVFFVISLFVLIAVMIGVVPLANTVEAVLGDATLSATTAQFPIILFFIEHLFTIALVQGFLIAIALYAKTRSVG